MSKDPQTGSGTGLSSEFERLTDRLGERMDAALKQQLDVSNSIIDAQGATINYLHQRIGSQKRRADSMQEKAQRSQQEAGHYRTLHDQLKQRFDQMNADHESRFQDVRARAAELSVKQKPYEDLANAIGAELCRTMVRVPDLQDSEFDPDDPDCFIENTYWTLPIYDANGEEAERLEVGEWIEKRKWCALELARHFDRLINRPEPTDPADDTDLSDDERAEWTRTLEKSFERMRTALGLDQLNPEQIADSVVAGVKQAALGHKVLVHVENAIEHLDAGRGDHHAKEVLKDLKALLLRGEV